MLTEEALLDVFRLREDEGPSKVTTLAEAIGRHVRPGMAIHTGNAAGAAVRALIRQFYGSKPEFTLACETVGDSPVALAIHS